MRIKGKITTWNDEKGFGFITPQDGGKQVFIHISDFNNRTHRPELNQEVVYALSHDKQNRICAKNATLAGDKLRKQPKGLLSIVFTVSFLAIVCISVLVDKAPPFILYLYLIASLFTFLKYALDKSAAKKSKWRTPESTLHLLSIIGGWPGALIAQQILRHKSKKLSFRIVFWFTVLLNCCGVAWLLTPDGIANLQLWIAKVF